MKGHGKHRVYELHHPMSLGDILAALFRRKPKKSAGGAAEVLGIGQMRRIDDRVIADEPSYSETATELAGAGDRRHD